MKKLFLKLTAIFISNYIFAQKINKTEFFTVSTSIDINSSIKEDGLNIVAEIEYVGVIYAKLGIERFEALTGGYRDIHGALGLNLTNNNERLRIYSGFRAAKVNRGHEGAYRINYGLEAGIDYDITENIFIGLRTALDKRYDQEIFGWNPENKVSGFIRLGYKWKYKSSGYYDKPRKRRH